MFLLYLLGCWTSIQFDFLSVLVVFCFYIVVLLVVRGGAVCLPMLPSWPEATILLLLITAVVNIYSLHVMCQELC